MSNTKDIKDYLHFFIGCEVMTDQGKGVLTQVHSDGDFRVQLEGFEGGEIISEIKPLLRPLSDMTEEEGLKWDRITDMETKEFLCGTASAINQFAEGTRFLLSKHFDIFDLIAEGLALDATQQDATT